MKAIAGALVVLAGAILLGAGVLANALVRSAGKSDDVWGLAAVGGVVLGIVGLAVLALSFSDRKSPP